MINSLVEDRMVVMWFGVAAQVVVDVNVLLLLLVSSRFNIELDHDMYLSNLS